MAKKKKNVLERVQKSMERRKRSTRAHHSFARAQQQIMMSLQGRHCVPDENVSSFSK